MVGHGGSSAGSNLADPTSPIPAHCASIVATSILRVVVSYNLCTCGPLQEFHEDGARIEAAFRRYVHRAEPNQKEDSYEILPCHGNVIRFFVCR